MTRRSLTSSGGSAPTALAAAARISSTVDVPGPSTPASAARPAPEAGCRGEPRSTPSAPNALQRRLDRRAPLRRRLPIDARSWARSDHAPGRGSGVERRVPARSTQHRVRRPASATLSTGRSPRARCCALRAATRAPARTAAQELRVPARVGLELRRAACVDPRQHEHGVAPPRRAGRDEARGSATPPLRGEQRDRAPRSAAAWHAARARAARPLPWYESFRHRLRRRAGCRRRPARRPSRATRGGPDSSRPVELEDAGRSAVAPTAR